MRKLLLTNKIYGYVLSLVGGAFLFGSGALFSVALAGNTEMFFTASLTGAIGFFIILGVLNTYVYRILEWKRRYADLSSTGVRIPSESVDDDLDGDGVADDHLKRMGIR